jgi:hypothetical protein
MTKWLLAEVSKRVAEVIAPLQPVKIVDRNQGKGSQGILPFFPCYSIGYLISGALAGWHNHCLIH